MTAIIYKDNKWLVRHKDLEFEFNTKDEAQAKANELMFSSPFIEPGQIKIKKHLRKYE